MTFPQEVDIRVVSAGLVSAAMALCAAESAWAAKPMTAPKIRVGLQTTANWDALGDLGYSQASLGRGAFPKSGFRLKGLKIVLSGDATENLGYYVMLDPANLLTGSNLSVQSTPAGGTIGNTVSSTFGIVNQAYGIFDAGLARLMVGQMKVPASAEWLVSALNGPTVESSVFASGANSGDFGAVNDVGALASVGSGGPIALAAGIFNGSGGNIAASSPKKIAVTRIDFKPLETFKLGASYLYGFKQGANAAAGPLFRNRHGADLEIALAPLKLNAEALFGVDDGKAESPKFGWYGMATFTANADHDFLAKFEGWNPNYATGLTGPASLQQYSALLGWTWSLGAPQTKFQLNYVHDFLPSALGGTVAGFLPDGANDRILSQLQVVL
ncbi:MAG: hypothetical protein FJZ00_04345 [Candidatus Sericytochromatia bacterium]|uniref:Porin n=1 Tax=Candidatus Tanganyikabacteria bacterium TaxID=2961651 RepID=A0A938BKL6_9BACT|nr:hypothetical protein [Candidatus Tanganyikabacteria bacterium]